MAFIFDEKTLSVYDQETDAFIVRAPGQDPRNAEWSDSSYLLLRYGTDECTFEIVIINIYPAEDYKSAYSKDYVPSKENDAKAGSSTTYILEDSLRRGLYMAMSGLGRPPLAEIEYQKIKKLLKDGLYVLKTAGGDRLEKFPGKKFSVEFEKDIATVAMKNPGMLKNYEQWARAYKKIP